MRTLKLGFLVILPSLLAYPVVSVHVPLAADVWLFSPFGWGLLFLAYWFWVGSVFGRGRDARASFLWGSAPTLLFGLMYLQQFCWTASAARSPLLSLLGQLYVFLVGPVSSVLCVSVLGISSISGTVLYLLAYAMMLAIFSLGFLWRRQRQVGKRRRRR